MKSGKVAEYMREILNSIVKDPKDRDDKDMYDMLVEEEEDSKEMEELIYDADEIRDLP